MRQLSDYCIESYSPYQDKDLEELALEDHGDLEIPHGDKVKTLDIVETKSREIISNGSIPIMIGGEHLLTLGAIKPLIEKYPDLHIIHFDAHTDMRDDYLGETLSHASVFRRISELVKPKHIHQFGIRSGTKEEFDFIKENHNIELYTADTLMSTVMDIQDKPVYISIDLDVLDPSVLPGTGTPEPNGLSYQALLESILDMDELQNIVGMDIVELNPGNDNSDISTVTACHVLRELTLILKGN